MRQTLEAIAQRAADAIMEIYRSGDFEASTKSDDTPLTRADMQAHNIIMEGLTEAFDYPVLSEEDPIDYETRKNWSTFWLVDPLDGTKSFIKKEDDFTVNIALIDAGQPVAGVLAVPVTQKTYSAVRGEGATCNGKPIYNASRRDDYKLAASRAHKSRLTQEFIKHFSIDDVESRGSSLKFGLLAEGVIDVYPRLGPTSEWDTAAGHAICLEAGCKVVEAQTGKPLHYNKPDILNPHFIACRQDLDFEVDFC